MISKDIKFSADQIVMKVVIAIKIVNFVSFPSLKYDRI